MPSPSTAPHAPLGRSATARLQRALGVTRIARVTGLDRSGIEVACAVRPGGHVLQVTNGKGESFEQAAAGALLEAAELFAAEQVDPSRLLFGSLEELAPRWQGEVWPASDLGSAGGLVAPELWSPGTRLAWRAVRELFSDEDVLVPAQALHCPPLGSPPLGPAVVAWTTNGSGAHPDRAAALLHALLEAVERDQLARALPEGWTAAEVARRLLPAPWLEAHAPGAAKLAGLLAGRGFEVHLFDLAPRRGWLRLPVAGAVLAAEDFGPVPVTAGYACRPHLDDALAAALLEAAQSRLTDIHGARDDIAPGAAEAERGLLSACRAAAGRRRQVPSPRRLPPVDGPEAGVELVLEALQHGGFRRAGAVDLAPDGLGVHAVKVVVPGFLVSELL